MEQKILIADDDVAVHSVVSRLLRSDGYNVVDAFSGEDVMNIALREKPQLILLDQNMPGKKGGEVYQDLRSNYSTSAIPIVFLTGRSSIHDRIQGLRNGADDYLFKPFDAAELLARIESVVKKSSFYLEANPLTRLPGNNTIEKKIREFIDAGCPFSVFYADINHFKAFNDRFGFLEGDNVIRKTGGLLANLGKVDGRFVGHIGGDDFVVISAKSDAHDFALQIIESFDRMCQESVSTSELSIAVGVISSDARSLLSLADVSSAGAEVKRKAKQIDQSGFVIDRTENLAA